ncbi:hypothetical protein COT97_02650 [Candidatus Falkowbacteria bacterium CG10_big_fil_rev_8_21_14_0_10_39_11]|uniref:Uncharacterized protein n=1 Tax=Candidatus Falkowbacteria bacterium CG10_big_fil_rev_8_21_14_0_10_39_11 TaxID=1974565 RepID=A0A2H0V761_9BACT|nr:MAG: hypothetical protein COT97_02650 [Candidatus Falkowbacteria bacterium CG10_big_fil_rev_8_21_14_0_10_39_11]
MTDRDSQMVYADVQKALPLVDSICVELIGDNMGLSLDLLKDISVDPEDYVYWATWLEWLDKGKIPNWVKGEELQRVRLIQAIVKYYILLSDTEELFDAKLKSTSDFIFEQVVEADYPKSTFLMLESDSDGVLAIVNALIETIYITLQREKIEGKRWESMHTIVDYLVVWVIDRNEYFEFKDQFMPESLKVLIGEFNDVVKRYYRRRLAGSPRFMNQLRMILGKFRYDSLGYPKFVDEFFKNMAFLRFETYGGYQLAELVSEIDNYWGLKSTLERLKTCVCAAGVGGKRPRKR